MSRAIIWFRVSIRSVARRRAVTGSSGAAWRYDRLKKLSGVIAPQQQKASIRLAPDRGMSKPREAANNNDT